ncbi:hypothetical protein CMV_017745 [Castanea mollissima]|uniref:Uncharacterized protein n=1 Tax=Castanea mollissima TaxID=60419 RepID=A0A8J4R186_9ROSI|nr:hypothetical protein CMV_017745 [Castanea mollissima]
MSQATILQLGLAEECHQEDGIAYLPLLSIVEYFPIRCFLHSHLNILILQLGEFLFVNNIFLTIRGRSAILQMRFETYNFKAVLCNNDCGRWSLVNVQQFNLAPRELQTIYDSEVAAANQLNLPLQPRLLEVGSESMKAFPLGKLRLVICSVRELRRCYVIADFETRYVQHV